jgi:membrane protein DedA with SNARE-associated domain
VEFSDIFSFIPVEVGYLGLSIVSFFGSLIPFVPIPSFLLLATMSIGEQFDIHILAILTAIAATAAKQIIFLVSYSGRRIMKEKTRIRMKPFERLVKRYGGAAAFFAAATPIPDDLVYIPLGLAKYNPKRFFIATLAGKIVLSYTVVLIARFFGLSYLDPLLEGIEDPTAIYVGIIIFGIAMTIIIILMLRLDWAKVLGSIAPWTLIDDDEKKS